MTDWQTHPDVDPNEAEIASWLAWQHGRRRLRAAAIGIVVVFLIMIVATAIWGSH